MHMPPFALVLTAAGSSLRFSSAFAEGEGVKKEFLKIDGHTVLYRAAEPFFELPGLSAVVVTCREGAEDETLVAMEDLVDVGSVPMLFIRGGATRQESVHLALERLAVLDLPFEYVAVHDGARPFVTPDLIVRTLAMAYTIRSGAMPALAVTDSVRRIDAAGRIEAYKRIAAIETQADADDVLDELDEEHRDVLLNHLNREDSEELRNLLNFDPDSAAGVMNTELILLEEDWTADQAIAHIRSQMEEKESPYYGYVVDRGDKLVGVLSLRDLMLARPGSIVGEAVAGRKLITVRYDTEKGEVANLLSHYNFMALPVVDYQGHIMGVVTYDDIMDIIHDEASADLLGMVGADPEETVDTPWAESVRKRLPWLVVNMFNSAISASVVYMTRDISPAGLMKAYEALGVKPQGKVAVKLSTGEGGNTHYLQPALIKDLVQRLDGTIVECNTAYAGTRGPCDGRLRRGPEEHLDRHRLLARQGAHPFRPGRGAAQRVRGRPRLLPGGHGRGRDRCVQRVARQHAVHQRDEQPLGRLRLRRQPARPADERHRHPRLARPGGRGPGLRGPGVPVGRQ